MNRTRPTTENAAAGRRLRPVLLPLAAGLLLGSGCTGYRLGSTLPPGIASVHVPTFVNRTREPQIEGETTRATIQEFQRDGTLKIADSRRADAFLDVALTDYRLQPLRYEKDRAKTTREYRMLLTAELVFKRATGEVVVRKRVVGEATFEPGSNLPTAKQEALPRAASDLAHRIVESVVEAW